MTESAAPANRSSAPGTAPETAASAAAESGFFQRHYFLLRRLHSLTGIVPIGVFVIEHLITNSAILLPEGAEHYQSDVDFIWGLPGLLYLEIFGIWLPLAFHGLLGLVYVFTGRPNSTTYKWADNRRYTWMRITGVIALIFIFIPLAQTRWGWTFGGLYDAPFDAENATLTTALSVQWAWPAALIFYLVGTLATIFHFANGLWTMAITWGLTLSVQGQRRWGGVCLALGIGLAAIGVAATVRFGTLDLEALREEAQQHQQQTEQEEQAPADPAPESPPAGDAVWRGYDSVRHATVEVVTPTDTSRS